MGSEMKAEIVRFGCGKYGIRVGEGVYFDLVHVGHKWRPGSKFYKDCKGSLDRVKEAMADFFDEPVAVDDAVVVDLDREPAEPAKQSHPRRINIDRHDLYFFLAAQIVVILLAGVYFK